MAQFRRRHWRRASACVLLVCSAAAAAIFSICFLRVQLGATSDQVPATQTWLRRRSVGALLLAGSLVPTPSFGEEASTTRITRPKGGPAAFSFELPGIQLVESSDNELPMLSKNKDEVAVYERKDGAVIEVGPLPESDLVRQIRASKAGPFQGRRTVKYTQSDLVDDYEYYELPQASGGGGPGAGRSTSTHYWLRALRRPEGGGAVMVIQMPRPKFDGIDKFDKEDKPVIEAILNSFRLES